MQLCFVRHWKLLILTLFQALLDSTLTQPLKKVLQMNIFQLWTCVDPYERFARPFLVYIAFWQLSCQLHTKRTSNSCNSGIEIRKQFIGGFMRLFDPSEHHQALESISVCRFGFGRQMETIIAQLEETFPLTKRFLAVEIKIEIEKQEKKLFPSARSMLRTFIASEPLGWKIFKQDRLKSWNYTWKLMPLMFKYITSLMMKGTSRAHIKADENQISFIKHRNNNTKSLHKSPAWCFPFCASKIKASIIQVLTSTESQRSQLLGVCCYRENCVHFRCEHRKLVKTWHDLPGLTGCISCCGRRKHVRT